MSDTLISPRADHSIRNRYDNFKRRNGPQNFRDILRQRCRERIKTKRGALFDNLRSLQNEESVRNALTKFIEKDLKELQSSCNLNDLDDDGCMDISESEPLSKLAVSDQEKWILEEYDRLIENTNAQAELANVVVCPLCSRGELKSVELSATITCSLCPLQLPLTVSLPHLETLILEAVDYHGQFCSEPPQFTICPDTFTSNLLLLCSCCGHVQQIV